MSLETGLGFLVFFPFIAGISVFAAGTGAEKNTMPELVSAGADGRTGKWKIRKPDSGQKQENVRDILVTGTVILEFLCAVWMAVKGQRAETAAVIWLPEVCGMGISFTLDGFRAFYGCIAAFMWMMAAIFSRQYFRRLHHRSRFYLFLLWTLGAVMGVFLSADLYTTFIFFEIMSFTSYVWVAQEENRPALRAASTYLAVAVIGGLVMLMGIFLLYRQLGTLAIRELADAAKECGDRISLYAAGVCLLFGFGAKAGAFPLHIWLPKAHPVAPAPASALLSGILTKTGIYGILIISSRLFFHDGDWGKLILAIGTATMFGGALLAVFSVDLKRTLACSSMSQIGFILVGIGMQGLLGAENALAVHGTFLHMVNHSLIKLILFMAAGVVFMNAGALNLNEIRGFGRKKPLLAGIFLTGALAIGGIPFFAGYVSKTLLHESIAEYGGMKAVEWIFLFSGGMTVAYMAKLFISVFVEKNENAALQEKYDGMTAYMSPVTVFSLTGSAVVLLIWGLFPYDLMDRAAELTQGFMGLGETGRSVSYFSSGNLQGALISIGIGVFLYVFLIRKCLMEKKENGGKEYRDKWPKWLDLEELLYRPILLTVLPAVFGVACRILDSFADGMVVLLRKTFYRDSPLPYERLEGNMFTAALGRALNDLQNLGNRLWKRRSPSYRDYVHFLAVKHEQIRETNHIIQRSLSFGLLLFCIGLSLTLLYIIFW